jgi:6,7-dimethyl-8-ribityllumazine synthase
MSAKVLEGHLDGKGLRIAIAVARFNETVTESLLNGALGMLGRMGVASSDVTVARVPGAFELTGVANRFVRSEKFDAVIVLGAVIRGETPHFDQVVGASTSGTATLAAQSPIPVIFGVLTTDNVEQAMNRAGLKSGNKGAEAAQTAIEMANLYRLLS